MGGKVAETKVRFKIFLQNWLGLDIRALAVLRMGLGTILIVDLINRLRGFEFFYTDGGAFTIADAIYSRGTYPTISLHLLSGDTYVQLGFFLLAGFFALLLIIGYKTNLVTLASWLLLISLHNRNFLVLQGGDVFLRVILFWSIFLPLGQVWSVDAALKRIQGDTRMKLFNVFTVAFVFQLFVLYVATGLFKNGAEWTQDYTATEYALLLDQFTNWFGDILLGFPTVMKATTIFALLLELFGVLLFFIPFKNHLFRVLMIVLFVSLHIGLSASMHLGLFPWIMVVAWLALLPTELFDWIGDRKVWESTRYAQLRKKISSILNRYESKSSRQGLGARSWQILLPVVEMFKVTFVSFLLLCTLIWNLNTLQYTSLSFPKPILDLYVLLRLDQSWDMFAPYPLKNDGWYVVLATKENNSQDELFSGSTPPDYEKPADVSETYTSQRWRKFFMNLNSDSNSKYRQGVAEYYCRQDDTYTKIELLFIEEYSVLGERHSETDVNELLAYYCY